jgi:hypothetical protein
MGCCGSKSKLQVEIPYEKVEKYKNLKLRIEQFLSNTDPKERMDSNKILDLLIKTSNEISDYEDELKKLKRSKNKNMNVSDELIEGISQDIKVLKDYHQILNNSLKESEYYFDNQINENINEEKLRNNNNNLNDIKNKDDSSILSSEKHFKKENLLYYRKYIRRNKKRNANNNRYNEVNNLRLNFLNQYEITNEDDKNNDFILTSENIPLDINNDLNLIFELDSGKKLLLHANQEEKFLNVVKRLSGKEEGYDNLKNLRFYDEEKDISENIANGDKIKDFGLTDFHLIQVKIIDKNNQI